MNAREKLDAVDEARADLHNAGRKERGPEEHAAQSPDPATWDDVELQVLGNLHAAASIRSKMYARPERLRSWWEERAQAFETDWQAHCASDEHAAWLRDGGPARLWAACNERKTRALKAADIVRATKGDPAAFEVVADVESWRMAEMVRLYLEQAAE